MAEPRGPRWSLLVLAALCLLPALLGGLWAAYGEGTGRSAGLALLGFFGSGVVVLGRQAFRS